MIIKDLVFCFVWLAEKEGFEPPKKPPEQQQLTKSNTLTVTFLLRDAKIILFSFPTIFFNKKIWENTFLSKNCATQQPLRN